jgi:hypothetical protein
VSLGEDGDHHLVDHLLLSDDDLSQLAEDEVSTFSKALDGLFVVRRQGSGRALRFCLGHEEISTGFL